MFYSHPLLARKASLDPLCEEILILAVLGASGILMGGVVIEYERKVKLLDENVTQLLVEINEAWKLKATTALDATGLSMGKYHVKYEAVTVPDHEGTDNEDFDLSLNFSNTNPIMELQRTAYFAMVQYIDDNGRGNDVTQQFHPVDAANITLDAYQTDMAFNCFERYIPGCCNYNFEDGNNLMLMEIRMPKEMQMQESEDVDDGEVDVEVDEGKANDEVGEANDEVGEAGADASSDDSEEDDNNDDGNDKEDNNIYEDDDDEEDEEEEVDEEEEELEQAALDRGQARLDAEWAAMSLEEREFDDPRTDSNLRGLEDILISAEERYLHLLETDPTNPNTEIARQEMLAADDAFEAAMNGTVDGETCHPRSKPVHKRSGNDSNGEGGKKKGKLL